MYVIMLIERNHLSGSYHRMHGHKICRVRYLPSYSKQNDGRHVTCRTPTTAMTPMIPKLRRLNCFPSSSIFNWSGVRRVSTSFISSNVLPNSVAMPESVVTVQPPQPNHNHRNIVVSPPCNSLCPRQVAIVSWFLRALDCYRLHKTFRRRIPNTTSSLTCCCHDCLSVPAASEGAHEHHVLALGEGNSSMAIAHCRFTWRCAICVHNRLQSRDNLRVCMALACQAESKQDTTCMPSLWLTIIAPSTKNESKGQT